MVLPTGFEETGSDWRQPPCPGDVVVRRDTMFCPQCGERALAARQRYCHACGAMMARRADVTQNNLVGDDSARAIVTLSALALSWAHDNKVRLLLVGSAIAVAVMVATAIAMVLLCLAIATAAAAIPLFLFIAAFWLAAWHCRRWVRW